MLSCRPDSGPILPTALQPGHAEHALLSDNSELDHHCTDLVLQRRLLIPQSQYHAYAVALHIPLCWSVLAHLLCLMIHVPASAHAHGFISRKIGRLLSPLPAPLPSFCLPVTVFSQNMRLHCWPELQSLSCHWRDQLPPTMLPVSLAPVTPGELP